MANWATTNYVIEGSKEDLQKIYDAIEKSFIPNNDASEGWEGTVLNTLGCTWEPRGMEYPDGYCMRGFISRDTLEFEAPSADNISTLMFSAEEAWSVTDFDIILKKKIPNVEVYWQTEEIMMDIYQTNDKEGKYFPEKFYADTCIDGNYQSDYFTRKEDMLKWLEEITDGKVKSEEDIEEFENNVNNFDDFINIHEFEIVEEDDETNKGSN